MGRVAKYKKVKSFDPYSKKNRGSVDLPNVGVWGLGDNGRKKKKRSLKAEKMHARKQTQRSKSKKGNEFMDDRGFDAPPTEKDEFDMADLVGSIKRQNVDKDLLGSSPAIINTQRQKPENYNHIVTSTGAVANIPKTDEDETKVNKLLKLEQQMNKQSQQRKQLSHARMEGESKNAFNKRTRAETREIIKQTNTVKNHEKLAKKKEFLKQKKKRKKGGYNKNNNYYDDNDDNDDQRDGKRQATDLPVRFNEQAERPPTFRQIPRGAQKKSNTSTIKEQKQTGMSEHQIEAENNAMELMRRRIQAQYKAIKSQRRDNGDFHL